MRQIYQSLSTSPAWTKTLLLITYDEHGGFYDYVRPPGLSKDEKKPSDGGSSAAPLLGVRVPAFVVSPLVPRRSVSRDVRDHTSLLSTILRRFCPMR